MLALLDGLHVLGFATASERSREQLLRNVALMGAAPAAGMSALTALTLAFAYAAPDPATGLNPTWQAFGYPGPPRVLPGGDAPLQTFTPSGDIDCDVVVVGSGAGGGLIAGVLAQAGHDVVVLEAGGSHNEADFSGLELPAFQQMFWRGGPTPTADFNVNLLAASTLGGGPTVNWSNCLRTPSAGARAVGVRVRPGQASTARSSTVTSTRSGAASASTIAARTSTARTSGCATARRR